MVSSFCLMFLSSILFSFLIAFPSMFILSRYSDIILYTFLFISPTFSFPVCLLLWHPDVFPLPLSCTHLSFGKICFHRFEKFCSSYIRVLSVDISRMCLPQPETVIFSPAVFLFFLLFSVLEICLILSVVCHFTQWRGF